MIVMWLMWLTNHIITEVKSESKIILLWFIFLFKYEYLNVYVPWVQVSIEDNEHLLNQRYRGLWVAVNGCLDQEEFSNPESSPQAQI